MLKKVKLIKRIEIKAPLKDIDKIKYDLRKNYIYNVTNNDITVIASADRIEKLTEEIKDKIKDYRDEKLRATEDIIGIKSDIKLYGKAEIKSSNEEYNDYVRTINNYYKSKEFNAEKLQMKRAQWEACRNEYPLVQHDETTIT